MSGENKGNQNPKVKDNKVNENDVSVEEELQWEIDQIDEAEKEIWEDAKVDIVPLLNKIKELEDQLQEKEGQWICSVRDRENVWPGQEIYASGKKDHRDPDPFHAGDDASQRELSSVFHGG